MPNPLLENVLPAELAGRGQVIDYKGEIGQFGRLVEIVEADLQRASGPGGPRGWRRRPVEMDLRFSWVEREKPRPRLIGSVRTSLPVVCQRCLNRFELRLNVPIDLVVIAGHESAGQAADTSGAEVWEHDGDTIRIADVVEEALVMALPLAPVHASRQDCGPLAGRILEDGPQTVRPFADLRSQLERAKK